MRILVVDDNFLVRAAVTRMLKHLEADCLEADNGPEALRIAAREHPELILCDYCMPRMSGMEVLRALRRAGNKVQFGLMTGEENLELHKKARLQGASFILNKPFALDAIKTLLSTEGLRSAA